MKRDELIILILNNVPPDGDVRVCNNNIHDESIQVDARPRRKSGMGWENEYFLLDGTTGY